MPIDEAQHQQDASTGGYAPQYDASGQPIAIRPGGFWARLVAFIVDYVIVFALSAVIASAFGVSVADWWWENLNSDQWSFTAFDWISTALYWAYFSVLVAVWSATVGKLLFGLEVVRMDGSKIGIGRAFARTLFYSLSGILLGIGFLMIAFREDKRGLHDLICDTKVVYR